MKKLFIFLIASFTFMLAGAQDANNSGEVVYIDSMSSVFRSSSYLVKAHKNRQLVTPRKTSEGNLLTISSREGRIKAYYTDSADLNDGTLHCLQLAMDLWESKLEINVPISFYFDTSYELEPEVEIMTTVGYSRVDRFKSQPNSLYIQNSRNITGYDRIVLNAAIDWDSSWAFDIDSGHDNLISCFVRHIGHILGFGSSIKTVNGRINFAINQTASDFDRLITDDQGNYLVKQSQPTSPAVLPGFLKKALYLQLRDKRLKLFSSEDAFVPYRSANYFSLPEDNVMNYPYVDKTRLFNINSETLEVMSAIGWNVKSNDAVISSTDINTVGYGSVYKTHVFHIQEMNNDRARWKYQVFDKQSNQYTDVATGTGTTFTVSPYAGNTDNIDDYHCLQGRIVCSIDTENGRQEASMPLSLEMRPHYESCEIYNVNKNTNDSYYSFDIKLHHYGTSSGQLVVCNEYGMSNTHYFNTSGETVIHENKALKIGQTYLDITLSNDYGETIKQVFVNDGNDRNASSRVAINPNDYRITANCNGMPIDETFIITDLDSCSFMLARKSGIESGLPVDSLYCDWTFNIVGDTKKILWKKPLAATGKQGCAFKMEPSFFGSDLNYLFRTEVDTVTNRTYNHCEIICTIKYGDRNFKVNFPCKLSVLPPKPSCEILSCWVEPEHPELITFQTVTLKIMAKDFDEGHVYVTNYPSCGLRFLSDQPMPYIDEVDWGIPGTGYFVGVANRYGHSFSDTVYPASEETAVDVPYTEDTVILELHQNKCIVKSPYTLKKASISNIGGEIVYSGSDVSEIEITLPVGMYILHVAASETKNRYYKFIIK